MSVVTDSTWPVKRMRFLTRRDLSEERQKILEGVTRATFLPMEAVGERGDLDLSITRCVEEVRNGYTQFFDGDVLIAKITPCFENGKGAVVNGTRNGVGFGTTELHVLTPTSEIDARFLYYTTVSDRFRKLGEAAMFGAAGQKRVPEEFVREYRIPVPPLARQRAIADYLGRETARLDALVAAKERLLALLAEKRRALVTRAVTRGLDPRVPTRDSGVPWLGEIPAHWELTRLKFLADVRGGLALGKGYRDPCQEEYPYISVANVQDGYLSLDDVKKIPVPRKEAENYLLRTGDVLMNEGGDDDKIGRGCVWNGAIAPCLHQNHVFAVRPWYVEPEWIDMWTSSDTARYHFQNYAKRTTNLASISAANIRELPLLVPPTEERREIVGYCTASLQRLAAAQSTIVSTTVLIKERRAALVGAAVTGRIDVGAAS